MTTTRRVRIDVLVDGERRVTYEVDLEIGEAGASPQLSPSIGCALDRAANEAYSGTLDAALSGRGPPVLIHRRPTGATNHERSSTRR